MTDSNRGMKKIPKKAPKKITLKKSIDGKKPAVKKVTQKKPVDKKPAVKKPSVAATKKTPVSSSNSPKKVQSQVSEVRLEPDRHEDQISMIVHEISQGFSAHVEQANEREERSLEMIKVLTDTLMMNHEKSQQEVQEKEKLQHTRAKQIIKRNRLIGIPAAIFAVLTIISIFYVINMLETALTSISTDMHKIQLSVGEISGRMDSVTLDISSMSGNIQQLSRNVTNMSKDLGVLSHTVAPAMQGMRNVRPWAP